MDLWLLGSSAHSAQLAAQVGLPYVFANHFGIPGMAQILQIYRDNYRPSDQFPEPTTLIPVNVVVGESADEAEQLALAYRLQSARLRTGGRMEPQRPVEELVDYDWTAAEVAHRNMGEPFLFVGDAKTVSSRLINLAGEFGANEIMISPVAGAYAADPMDEAVNRARSIQMLADELL